MKSFILLLLCCCVLGNIAFDYKNVKKVTKKEFAKVTGNRGVTVVYFLVEFHPGQQGEPIDRESALTVEYSVRNFKKQYDKSASILKLYNIELCVVDCSLEPVEEYCQKDQVYNEVFIFRSGVELLNIGVDSMFDTNSIVSNVLQVALLREVPILQSASELREYEQQSVGESNILFSYQIAVGTQEHRVLMEVAFVYKDKYKFAITTDKDTLEGFEPLEENDESALWLLQCKNTRPGSACPMAKFYGSMSLSDLSDFILGLDVIPIFEKPNSMEAGPYPDSGLHIVNIYYDKESAKYVLEEADKLSARFRGSVGINMINVYDVDAGAAGLPLDGRIPALGFQNKYQGSAVFMGPEDEPVEFIEKQLKNFKPSSDRIQNTDAFFPSNFDEDEREHLSDVEVEDDEVALTAARLKKQTLDQNNLPTLTDKTFYTAETRDQPLLIVMFHLPFDPVSSTFLHSFVHVADSLTKHPDYNNPLASLNCYDWTYVCSRENVTSWPTIRVYRPGQQTVDYRGMLSPQAMLKAAIMYQHPAPIILSSQMEVEKLAMGQLPQSPLMVDSVILGVTEAGDTEGQNIIHQLAKELYGQTIVGLASLDIAFSPSSLPAVMAFKTKDPYQPQVVTSVGDGSVQELVDWAKNAVLPVLSHLTPVTLPALYAKSQSILIFFTPSPDAPDTPVVTMETLSSLGNMAASDQYTDVAFTWMDSSERLNQQIMVAYTGEHETYSLVLVRLKQGQVYVYPEDQYSTDSVKEWLDNILNNNLDPTRKLLKGSWKPRNPGYDFLKQMDQEKEKKFGLKDKHGRSLFEPPIQEEITTKDRRVDDEFPELADEMESNHMQEVEETTARANLFNRRVSSADQPRVSHGRIHHTEL